ncbi:hypothetical protein FRC02_010303 [Tulasnella sp. 418]|nr:hypothetical protein FRC02_010303 [Tulasnella sp. 418]
MSSLSHRQPEESEGASSGASAKKRKSRELQVDPLLDQEDSEYATLRSTLLKTHNLLASVDPPVLQKYLLAKLDDALLMSLPSNRRRLSLAGDSLPSRGSREGDDHHRRTSSLSSASFLPGPGGPSSHSSSTAATTNIIPGSTAISITTPDPTISQSHLFPSSSSSLWSSSSLSSSALTPIRAFSLIFEDFQSVYIPASSSRSNHQSHLSSSSASNSSPSWSPTTSRSTASSVHRHTTTTDKGVSVDEAESHCARCHLDYFPSKNTSRSCIIEHNQESCVQVSKIGQGSSVWKYECCNYKFTPEDPKEDTDTGSFCFVGRHTTDEKVAAAKKMNTFSCEEIGCWEEDDEADEDEDMNIREKGDIEQPGKGKATATPTSSAL